MPLVVKNGNRVSNYTSIAVAPNGGRCSDPFGFSDAELSAAEATGRLRFGSVNLSRIGTKVSAAGLSIDSTIDVGAASFIEYNLQQVVASRGPGGNSVSVGACTLFTYSGASTQSVDPIRSTPPFAKTFSEGISNKRNLNEVLPILETRILFLADMESGRIAWITWRRRVFRRGTCRA